MGNQGRQGDFSNNYSQGWRSKQQLPSYPSVTERLNKLEDTWEKFMKATMANQRNNMATIRNMEIQIGQMAKQLVERQSCPFSANAQTNPKEHCNEIASRSGKITGGRDGNNVVAEKRKEKGDWGGKEMRKRDKRKEVRKKN